MKKILVLLVLVGLLPISLAYNPDRSERNYPYGSYDYEDDRDDSDYYIFDSVNNQNHKDHDHDYDRKYSRHYRYDTIRVYSGRSYNRYYDCDDYKYKRSYTKYRDYYHDDDCYDDHRYDSRIGYIRYNDNDRYSTHHIYYDYKHPSLFDDDVREEIRELVNDRFDGDIEKIEQDRYNGRDVWKVTVNDDGFIRIVYISLRSGRIV